jgi:hypothetical protein
MCRRCPGRQVKRAQVHFPSEAVLEDYATLGS